MPKAARDTQGVQVMRLTKANLASAVIYTEGMIKNPEEYLEQLEKKQQWESAIKEQEKTCPKCGSLLQVRNGKWGAFRKCSNYPNCKYTESIIQK